MSPEQARGRAVDKRADIWAFGCVLWEMLVGERLFKGEDITETLASVVKDEPQWDRVPVNVRGVLRACLERDPKKRLRDIADVWRLLAEEPAVPVSRDARASRAWIGWAVAGVLLAAVIGFGIERLRQPASTPMAPLRFHIPFPPNTRPLRSIHALSPDGQKLAFVAGEEATRQSRVWVHELQSLASRPLPGTEGAIGTPFWSADSKTVVFATAGRQPLQSPNTLKKIAIAGGPALTLGTIPSILRGGFQAPDGTLVLGVGSQPLVKMSSAGGSFTPITTTAKDETGHYYPCLLSDRRHFIYLRAQGVNRGAIHLGTLGQTSAVGADPRVMDKGTNVVYVPSRDPGHGFIVFADGDALLAVPFDEKTLRVAGEPIPVSQGIGRGVSDPQLGLIAGAANGTLIYQEAGSLPSRRLTWFDRRGMPTGKVGEPGQFGTLRLSPTGSRVVYEVRQGQREEIWLFDLERGNRSRLVQNTGTNWAPVWSPDESTIIYTSSQKAPTALYRISVGGGNEERVVEGANASDWSHDGRFVVFQSLPGRSPGLFLLPDPARGSGGGPIRLTDSAVPEEQVRMSPDGRQIAYVSDRSGEAEVYVRSIDPAAPSKVGPETHVSTDGGAAPKWRADGRELVYRSSRGIMSVAVEAGAAPRLAQPQLLFALPNDAEAWDMSSDGSRFLVALRVGDYTPPPFTVLLNWQSAIGR
jgi:Tol biopolymer transport system component